MAPKTGTRRVTNKNGTYDIPDNMAVEFWNKPKDSKWEQYKVKETAQPATAKKAQTNSNIAAKTNTTAKTPVKKANTVTKSTAKPATKTQKRVPNDVGLALEEQMTKDNLPEDQKRKLRGQLKKSFNTLGSAGVSIDTLTGWYNANKLNEQTGGGIKATAPNATKEQLSKAADAVHKYDNATTMQERDAAQNEAIDIKNEANPEGTEKIRNVENGEPVDDVVEKITSDPNLETELNKVGLTGEHEPTPEEMQAAGEQVNSNLQANGMDEEDANNIKNAKSEEEFTSVIDKNAEKIGGGWDKWSKILTVASVVVAALTGGMVPPMDFTQFSDYDAWRANRRADIDKQEATKRNWENIKTNIDAKDALKAQLRKEHPDWTDEQIEAEINQANIEGYKVTEEGAAAAYGYNAEIAKMDHTTPDQAMEYVRQIDQQIVQIDNAIRDLDKDNIETAIQAYGSLVPTFAALSTSASSSTNQSNSGFNAGAGFFGVSAGGSYGNQSGTQASTTALSREGKQVADTLLNEYKTNAVETKRQMRESLERAKATLLEQKKFYQANAAEGNQTAKAQNTVVGGVTAGGVSSDVRKKHVYIPADKRVKKYDRR